MKTNSLRQNVGLMPSSDRSLSARMDHRCSFKEWVVPTSSSEKLLRQFKALLGADTHRSLLQQYWSLPGSSPVAMKGYKMRSGSQGDSALLTASPRFRYSGRLADSKGLPEVNYAYQRRFESVWSDNGSADTTWKPAQRTFDCLPGN